MNKDETRLNDTEAPGPKGNEAVEVSPDETRARRRSGFWWRAVIIFAVVAGIAVTLIAKLSKGRRPQEEYRRGEARRFDRKAVLATVNEERITLADLESEFQGLPEQYRSEYRNQKHELLEELIVRRLLLQEAKRQKVEETPAYKEALAGRSAQPGQEQAALINALLRKEVFDRIEVTEEELRDFYEQHKAEIPGGLAFDAVKVSLRSSVAQQKRYEALEKYISEMKKNAEITRNEAWIEAQKALTANNPLDRALSTGRPVVADLGRGTCIPCKMMKPVLEELAKEYKGKAEILIIDIGEYSFLARRCGVRVIPTQIFYDASGNEVYRHEGFMPREQIHEQLAKLGVE